MNKINALKYTVEGKIFTAQTDAGNPNNIIFFGKVISATDKFAEFKVEYKIENGKLKEVEEVIDLPVQWLELFDSKFADVKYKGFFGEGYPKKKIIS